MEYSVRSNLVHVHTDRSNIGAGRLTNHRSGARRFGLLGTIRYDGSGEVVAEKKLRDRLTTREVKHFVWLFFLLLHSNRVNCGSRIVCSADDWFDAR